MEIHDLTLSYFLNYVSYFKLIGLCKLFNVICSYDHSMLVEQLELIIGLWDMQIFATVWNRWQREQVRGTGVVDLFFLCGGEL